MRGGPRQVGGSAGLAGWNLNGDASLECAFDCGLELMA